MAKAIVVQIGSHKAYWGLCCGSLAVEFAKPPVSHETVCDLNGDVTNLAWCLQHDGLAEQLFARSLRTMHSDAVYHEACAVLRDPFEPCPEAPNLDRAYAYLVVGWQGMNGMVGIKGKVPSFALRWAANGGHRGSRWRRIVETIPSWAERLRGMTVLRRDVFDVVTKIQDADGVAIYADPPYVRTSRSGSEEYTHEFETNLFHDDHQRLADELARFQKARVVVSYYDCWKVREMYDGWTFIEHERLKNLSLTGSNGGKAKSRAKEVLIVNGAAN